VQGIAKERPAFSAWGDEADIVQSNSPQPAVAEELTAHQPCSVKAPTHTHDPDVLAARALQIAVKLYPKSGSSAHWATSHIYGHGGSH
jgi:hypothetical protein